MRHRVDNLQAEVVRRLRAAGWSVQPLTQVGNGVPDLLVATPTGETFLIEVKSGRRPLSPRQAEWIRQWQGRVVVVHSLDELETLLGGPHGGTDSSIPHI